VPQAKTGDEALDRIINVEWPYSAENCDTSKMVGFLRDAVANHARAGALRSDEAPL
jgi:hypothetical protein